MSDEFIIIPPMLTLLEEAAAVLCMEAIVAELSDLFRPMAVY